MAQVRLEDLLQQFLEDLARASTEKLLAEIEEAREDSKDSWMFDEDLQDETIYFILCTNKKFP